MVELLEGKMLLNCIGETVPSARVLKKKRLILFYFSASWSIPCIKLLPILKEVYKDYHKIPNGFELIYISADDNAELMMKFFKEKHSVGWYAVPFGDPLSLELTLRYDVSHIPQIIVVRVSDGLIITRTGYEDLLNFGADALTKWRTD